MFELIASIILSAATLWIIACRIKFEKNCSNHDLEYVSIFRRHSNLDIIIYLACSVYFILKVLKIS